MFNYFNFFDYGLFFWQLNNSFKPADFLDYSFGYEGNEELYEAGVSKYYRTDNINYSYLDFGKDRYQVFAYIAESRSQPLGAVSAQGGFDGNVNIELRFKFDDAHYSHSRQFRSNIISEKPYWTKILDDSGFGYTN